MCNGGGADGLGKVNAFIQRRGFSMKRMLIHAFFFFSPFLKHDGKANFFLNMIESAEPQMAYEEL